ncbi:hypothetical protein HZH68_007322 [Vespula germanica]|uniref:Uncharacterized protein n=1 Tax=Vespula germanica TaxID=30212 RepID=A0A834K8U0_VESGE|nr:hypothetical protein HZH68_007322 [Vespula germanica]
MAIYIIPILVKITGICQKFYNIPMECFDTEDDEFYNCENKQEENEMELFNNKNNNNKIIEEENVQKSSESEFENILNLRKEKRLARVLLSSEDENENQMGLFLQFTKWTKNTAENVKLGMEARKANMQRTSKSSLCSCKQDTVIIIRLPQFVISIDLTTLDFFVWGKLQQKVYQQPSTTLENMKNHMNACAFISTEIKS